MRQYCRLYWLIAVLSAVVSADSLHAERLSRMAFRHSTYSDAWHSSKKSGKPMLVFVTMNDCHYCRKMERETYATPRILGTLAKTFEAVNIERANQPDLVERFQVRIFPTTFIVSPEGKIVDRMEGYVSPKKLAVHLSPAHRVPRAEQATK